MMDLSDHIKNNVPASNFARLYVAPLSDHLLNDIKAISAMLDSLPRYPLLNNSWPWYRTMCSAYFTIACTQSAIVIKFYVVNDYFKSLNRGINEAVHKDNCVEFFVAFEQEEAYYNIEFNCLGIGKMAYGKPSAEREFLPESTIRQIETHITSNNIDNGFNWEITLFIPVSVFEFNRVQLKNGLSCHANFYKCGDDLPAPHYLSWQKIEAPEPDFHRPVFFGNIVFGDVGIDEELLSTNKNENIAVTDNVEPVLTR